MSTELRTLLDGISSSLERALHDHSGSFTNLIDVDQQLRLPYCTVASKAVQIYLAEQHGIESAIVINREIVVSDYVHALLTTDGVMIDPTYGQFVESVGLDHLVARTHGLKGLYPNPKIALFDINKSDDFADSFNNHLTVVTSQLPAGKSGTREHLLRGVPSETRRQLFRSLWNIDNFGPYESTNPHFNRAARDIAESIHIAA